MTVSNKIPIAEYTGDGNERVFAWDWDMIEDSTINVLLDDSYNQAWSLQGQTVVFDVAPPPGAEIVIFRRTKIWMPENYRAFGRFNSEKTELSMDRIVLITQERMGTAVAGEAPNGIVGSLNIYTELNEFDVTIVSERGTDAVAPLWNSDGLDPPTPEPPDATIIWEGTDISGGVYSLEGNTSGVSAIIRFRMDYNVTQAEAYYNNFNDFVNVGWLNVDPADNEYWMRVTLTNGLSSSRYSINDGDNFRSSGEAFQIKGSQANPVLGPYVTVNTFGDTPPSTRTGEFNIEICKDSNGLPDNDWASRNVTLEAIFSDIPEPPPFDPTGSVTWDSFFGLPFELGVFYPNVTAEIPPEGLSIRFTVPDTSAIGTVKFASLETPSNPGIRDGSVNQSVLNFSEGATLSWGLGGRIVCSINYGGEDIELIRGQTYVFNIRVRNPQPPGFNFVTVQCSTL